MKCTICLSMFTPRFGRKLEKATFCYRPCALRIGVTFQVSGAAGGCRVCFFASSASHPWQAEELKAAALKAKEDCPQQATRRVPFDV